MVESFEEKKSRLIINRADLVRQSWVQLCASLGSRTASAVVQLTVHMYMYMYIDGSEQ